MNHLLNITKKELRELLTPGTIVSILVVVVMFSALGSAMSGESEKMTAPQHMGVVYGDGTQNYDADFYTYTDKGTEVKLSVRNLVVNAYHSTFDTDDYAEYIHYFNASYGDSEAIAKEMADNDCSFVISIPGDFTNRFNTKTQTTISTYYSYTNGGIMGTVTSTQGTVVVNSMSTLLTYALTCSSTTDPVFALNPLKTGTYTTINGTVYEGVSPSQIYNSLSGQNLIIPIIMMIIIIMVGSVVISSMGSEKENKTLETLLTMPIKRTTIVIGKILAATIMGLVYGVCYLAGMMIYSNGMMSGISGGSVNLADYGLAMSAVDWLILLVILFLSIFSALGICMILGAFTKNYKMAQTMTLPISGLAIIPMFVFMFASWDTLPGIVQALMFLIPFSHPMMGMDNLLFGNTTLILAGIAYLAVFDIIMILITVKIYNSDILITGLGQNPTVVKLKKMFKVKEKEHADN